MKRRAIGTTPEIGSGMKEATYSGAQAALHELANPKQAALLSRFFKTGKGEYAEGDRFLGIMVPSVRLVARKFQTLPLSSVERLLKSPFNEERLLGLVILIRQFEKGDADEQRAIYRLYRRNLKSVNNWNLVDISAPRILGAYLLNRKRTQLYTLARSKNLWLRRVAVLSTFQFIQAGEFNDSLKLTKMLLTDSHDLMHKACGWMLREIGKRDVAVLERFLMRNHHQMPRTMLRYAIERLPERKRRFYLYGNGRRERKPASSAI